MVIVHKTETPDPTTIYILRKYLSLKLDSHNLKFYFTKCFYLICRYKQYDCTFKHNYESL